MSIYVVFSQALCERWASSSDSLSPGVIRPSSTQHAGQPSMGRLFGREPRPVVPRWTSLRLSYEEHRETALACAGILVKLFTLVRPSFGILSMSI